MKVSQLEQVTANDCKIIPEVVIILDKKECGTLIDIMQRIEKTSTKRGAMYKFAHMLLENAPLSF